MNFLYDRGLPRSKDTGPPGPSGERLSRYLKSWHLLFFWSGLLFDATGTVMMHLLAGGRFDLSLHSLTGALALLLMAVHAIWATLVLWRHHKSELEQFHRLSLIVWIFWLIPYGTGVVLNSGLLK
nr:HsmA family protein [Dictyobacter alpinus]